MTNETREQELKDMGFVRSRDFERGPINSLNNVGGMVILTIDEKEPFVAPEALFTGRETTNIALARKLSHFISANSITSSMAA